MVSDREREERTLSQFWRHTKSTLEYTTPPDSRDYWDSGWNWEGEGGHRRDEGGIMCLQKGESSGSSVSFPYPGGTCRACLLLKTLLSFHGLSHCLSQLHKPGYLWRTPSDHSPPIRNPCISACHDTIGVATMLQLSVFPTILSCFVCYKWASWKKYY